MTRRNQEINLSEDEFRRLLRGNVKLRVTTAALAIAFAVGAGAWAADTHRLLTTLVRRSETAVQIAHFNHWVEVVRARNPSLSFDSLFQPPSEPAKE